MSAGTILLALFSFAGALHLLLGGVPASTAADEMRITLVAFVQFYETCADSWLLGSVISWRSNEVGDEEASRIGLFSTLSATARSRSETLLGAVAPGTPTLFQRSWWLDALAPRHWDAV